MSAIAPKGNNDKDKITVCCAQLHNRLSRNYSNQAASNEKQQQKHYFPSCPLCYTLLSKLSLFCISNKVVGHSSLLEEVFPFLLKTIDIGDHGLDFLIKS